MSIKLKISVTKEILERSKMCGFDNIRDMTTNCAIALAIRDVFPQAIVETEELYFFGDDKGPKASLPKKAINFIIDFDLNEPDLRVDMNPISFNITIPAKVIKQINIEEVKILLTNHPTLELV